MRVNEFQNQLKLEIRLGEITTPMCFLKKNGNYTPAVLCIQLAFEEGKCFIEAIPAIIYWDTCTQTAKREQIPFQIQEELGIPINLKIQDKEIEEIGETKEDNPNSDSVKIEEICYALDLDCVTPSMKLEYRNYMKFDFDKEAEKVFWYFFPDAMKKMN